MDYIERIERLLSDSEDCLSRLYFFKSQFIAASAPSKPNESTSSTLGCLSNPEFTKIKQKILKGFPAVPEISKVQGYDIFVSSARDIMTSLELARLLINDVVNFVESAKDLIQTISTNILDFQMEKNRNLMIMFFDLFTSYIRVLWVFSTIDDKKVIFSLYELSVDVSKPAESPFKTIQQSSAKTTKLIQSVDDIHLTLIQTFWPYGEQIKSMILQFRDSISFAEDCDTLRDQCVFNPLSDGQEKMSKYASGTISPTSALMKFTELRDVEKYREYYIFSCLTCPFILADVDVLTTFKLVAKGTIFIPIYRDITFNVHMEFEILAQIFPLTSEMSNGLLAAAAASATPAIAAAITNGTMMTNLSSYPPGFKLKKVLKDLARVAITTAGVRHKERRYFIRDELEALNHVLTTIPGLTGPKLPQVIAAASFAKNEIVNHFRIEGLLTLKAIRKDARKYFEPKEYGGPDVIVLLFELRRLVDHVNKHRAVVVDYYSEYLTGLDTKALKTLCTKCGSLLEGLQDKFTSILEDLDILAKQVDKKRDFLPDSSQALLRHGRDASAKDIEPETISLTSFRRAWNVLTAVLYSKNMIAVMRHAPTIQELTLRIQGAYERSLYIDDIDGIFGRHMEPFDVYWFRDVLASRFHDAINNSTFISSKASSLLMLLPSVKHNLSNNVEDRFIQSSAVIFMDERCNDLGNQAVSLVKALWTNLQALENQITPLEASRRIEKAVAQKANNVTRKELARTSDGGFDAMPGTESEAWAKQSIEKLADICLILSNITSLSRHVNIIQIFDREYNLPVLLRQRIVAYVEDQLINLFSSTSDAALNGVIVGPDVLHARLKSLLHAAQIALDGLNSHISTSFRTILFKECCDLSFPPPGVPTTVSGVSGSGAGVSSSGKAEYWGTFLWKVSDWFMNLCEHVTGRTAGNEVIWAPYVQAFIRSSIPTLIPSSTGGGFISGMTSFFQQNSNATSTLSPTAQSLVTFLSRTELAHICELIGVQGVRVLDQQIINAVLEKVVVLKEILFVCQQDLHGIQMDSSSALDIYAIIEAKISPAHDALMHIGLLLAIREILHLSLGDVVAKYSPSLSTVSKNACEAIIPWGDRKLASPLHYLAFDCGHIHEVDLALAQALAPYLSRPSDRSHLSLLPVLGSMTLLDSSWKKSQYLSQYDAFSGNEHAIYFALSKLMVCCFGKETQVEIESSLIVELPGEPQIELSASGNRRGSVRMSNLTSSSVNKASNRQSIRYDGGGPLSPSTKKGSSKRSVEGGNDRRNALLQNRSKLAQFDMKTHSLIFLSLSAQILYMMTEDARYGRSFPVVNMVTLLEYFTRITPLLKWSDLNEIVPYGLLHCARVDSVSVSTKPVGRGSLASQVSMKSKSTLRSQGASQHLDQNDDEDDEEN